MSRSDLPRTTRAVEALLRPPLALITRKDYRGLENLPAEGGFVIAANHNSHLDPILLARFLLDVGIVPRYLAKEGLFTHKLTGPILRGADQILVVEGGTIVQRGTHDELIAAGGLYAELYRTQFQREPVVD